MKLLVLKLIALVVFLGGLLFLGMALDVNQAWDAYHQALGYWPAIEDGVPYFGVPGILIGALIALIGFYAFIPRFPSGKNDFITHTTPDGSTVLLQLAPLRKSLLKVMKKMPEVAKINVHVRPERGRKTARVAADVILNGRKDFSEEDSAQTVAQVLSVTCKEVLGFSELSTIIVNVRGIRVDAEEASEQVRAHLTALQTQKEEAEKVPCCEEVIAEAAADAQEEAAAETVETEAAVVAADESPCCAEAAKEVPCTEAAEEAPAVEAAAETAAEAEEAPAIEEAVEEEVTEEEDTEEDVADAAAEDEAQGEESDTATDASSFSLPPLSATEEETPPLILSDSVLPVAEDEENIPDAVPEAEALEVPEAEKLEGSEEESKEEDTPQNRWQY